MDYSEFFKFQDKLPFVIFQKPYYILPIRCVFDEVQILCPYCYRSSFSMKNVINTQTIICLDCCKIFILGADKRCPLQVGKFFTVAKEIEKHKLSVFTF